MLELRYNRDAFDVDRILCTNHKEFIDMDYNLFKKNNIKVKFNIKNIPVIIGDRCVGCNLCSLVCPVECITMIDVSQTDRVETWQDIIARGGYVVTDGLSSNND